MCSIWPHCDLNVDGALFFPHSSLFLEQFMLWQLLRWGLSDWLLGRMEWFQFSVLLTCQTAWMDGWRNAWRDGWLTDCLARCMVVWLVYYTVWRSSKNKISSAVFVSPSVCLSVFLAFLSMYEFILLWGSDGVFYRPLELSPPPPLIAHFQTSQTLTTRYTWPRIYILAFFSLSQRFFFVSITYIKHIAYIWTL